MDLIAMIRIECRVASVLSRTSSSGVVPSLEGMAVPRPYVKLEVILAATNIIIGNIILLDMSSCVQKILQ
jgi:hypothetical protein